MPDWFYHLPIYLALVLIFGLCNMISLFGYMVSHRFLSRVDNKDVVTKVVWQTVLFFSTIFITFWIATNWSNLGNLKQTTIREANSVAQLYNDVGSLGGSNRHFFEIKIWNYLDLVINDEYKHLAKGEESPKTNAAFRDLVLSIYDYQPLPQLSDELRYNRILEQMTNLSNYRENRLAFLSGNLNGPLLLFFIMMIVVGCFWTGFIYTRSLRFTLFIIMSQNLIMSSSSWLILEMDMPFQGQLRVDKTPFISVQDEISTFSSYHGLKK
jgi:ABC-type multidrug transport system fused ATPase/permease subunit